MRSPIRARIFHVRLLDAAPKVQSSSAAGLDQGRRSWEQLELAESGHTA